MEIQVRFTNGEMRFLKRIFSKCSFWKRFQKRHWQQIYGCKKYGGTPYPDVTVGNTYKSIVDHIYDWGNRIYNFYRHTVRSGQYSRTHVKYYYNKFILGEKK